MGTRGHYQAGEEQHQSAPGHAGHYGNPGSLGYPSTDLVHPSGPHRCAWPRLCRQTKHLPLLMIMPACVPAGQSACCKLWGNTCDSKWAAAVPDLSCRQAALHFSCFPSLPSRGCHLWHYPGGGAIHRCGRGRVGGETWGLEGFGCTGRAWPRRRGSGPLKCCSENRGGCRGASATESHTDTVLLASVGGMRLATSDLGSGDGL